VSLMVLVAVALLAQQTSGVSGELAAAADRKSRKRQSVPPPVPPLFSVDDDPYETDAHTNRNSTSNRHASAGRQHFEFVNPKPGTLNHFIS